MPHSSGGGSHGGGHHGGSHSRSGGGSGRSYPRVSTTRYIGSHRYSYYDRNGLKQYIYCSTDPAKAYKPRWYMLIFYIPFIIAIFLMCGEIVDVPSRIDNPDSEILIEDNIGVLADQSGVKDALRRFYNDTGVTPAVITVYHEDWNKNYSNLEKYAFDLYVNRFRDEKHWLVVYSLPKRKAGGFLDWKWEGMIGNDAGRMINYRDEDYFTEQMQKNLGATDGTIIDEALKKTFADTAVKAAQVSVDLEALPAALFVLAFVTLHAALMIGLTPKSLRYSKAVYDPEPRDMPVTCTYCRGTFILGDKTNCPNCGAPLEAQMKQAEETAARMANAALAKK